MLRMTNLARMGVPKRISSLSLTCTTLHQPSLKNVKYYSMSKHLLADTGAPICPLEVKHHFDQLQLDDKRYAHHFSRAAHWGTRVVLRQVSAESEDIYDLILAIHRELKGDYKKLESVSAEEVQWYLEYASQFLSNLGNYKSFGDSKFIPRASPEAFETIAQITPETRRLFAGVKDRIYSTQPKSANLLGYADRGHTTTYYGGGITVDEINAVQTAMAEVGLLPENTRLFKTSPTAFELKIASALKPETMPEVIKLANNSTLTLNYGDHAREFSAIVAELTQAQKYARNESQATMISAYRDSFQTGSMQSHKDSQAAWVADIGPPVETNLGFIESYRDPHGVRGEWEGLVAMVNRERTLKFAALVRAASQYIQQLPWPAAFEKDEFTPPDFSSLEVMTFAGSGIPAGINIPNYDDIRINVGFKNVSLGNILSAKAPNEKTTFIKDTDLELFNQLRSPAFEVQVGIHELLGHGTGKLLAETTPGVYNFDVTQPPLSPIDNLPISSYYKPGQTWGSVFGSIAASYEECRAETVAMFLCTDPDLLSIFGHSPSYVGGPVDNGENIMYISYLQMARAGFVALEFYDPSAGKWGQAHMQARFSILKCFMDAGQGFVTLDYTKDDMSDLVINLDRTKILSVGKPAVEKYLQKLHIYKTTADFEAGSELYARMTAVDANMVKFRQLVMDAKLPRKQFVQANSFVNQETGEVELREYTASEIGMIESFVEREV